MSPTDGDEYELTRTWFRKLKSLVCIDESIECTADSLSSTSSFAAYCGVKLFPGFAAWTLYEGCPEDPGEGPREFEGFFSDWLRLKASELDACSPNSF